MGTHLLDQRLKHTLAQYVREGANCTLGNQGEPSCLPLRRYGDHLMTPHACQKLMTDLGKFRGQGSDDCRLQGVRRNSFGQIDLGKLPGQVINSEWHGSKSKARTRRLRNWSAVNSSKVLSNGFQLILRALCKACGGTKAYLPNWWLGAQCTNNRMHHVQHSPEQRTASGLELILLLLSSTFHQSLMQSAVPHGMKPGMETRTQVSDHCKGGATWWRHTYDWRDASNPVKIRGGTGLGMPVLFRPCAEILKTRPAGRTRIKPCEQLPRSLTPWWLCLRIAGLFEPGVKVLH